MKNLSLHILSSFLWTEPGPPLIYGTRWTKIRNQGGSAGPVTGNVRDILIKPTKWKWPLIKSSPKRFFAEMLAREHTRERPVNKLKGNPLTPCIQDTKIHFLFPIYFRTCQGLLLFLYIHSNIPNGCDHKSNRMHSSRCCSHIKHNPENPTCTLRIRRMIYGTTPTIAAPLVTRWLP